jgi:glycosyltransferase involved in cell wall biosynthesis
VLVSGWIVPHKNQRLVIDAVARLSARGQHLPIVFVGPNTAHLGDGSAPGFRTLYVQEVQAALRSAGMRLGQDYFALGYVSDLELQALLRLATVFACPSTYEGFGLPGLEAMRAKCPVLLSSIAPFEEQNRRLGGALRTFDPRDPAELANQLEWVASHPDEVANSADQLAARVGDVYDWKKTAVAYLDAFDELLRGKSSAHEDRTERMKATK